MPEIKNSDVLAYFKQDGAAKPIAAESQSALESSDTMLTGFQTGYYFTADAFTFGMNLGDDEGGNPFNEDDTRSFSRWRSLKVGQNKPDPPFQPEPDDISITRMIDSSSPILLSHCLDDKSFASVVIVKRARRGVDGLLLSVLRFEFSTVWIKVIEWEDDDAVMESIKFKYNEVKAVYAIRRPDGTIGTSLECGWKNPHAKPKQ